MKFTVPADHRVKLKESENRDKWLDLAGELKKLLNMKVTTIPIIISVLGTVTKGLVQEQEVLEIRGRVETNQTSALLRSDNTEKSPGDLRGLAITQTPVENHQLMPVWKTLNE